MIIEDITENEDGSADVSLKLTPNEVSTLLSDALLRAIRLCLKECEDGVRE